jgi:hypothetical protein
MAAKQTAVEAAHTSVKEMEAALKALTLTPKSGSAPNTDLLAKNLAGLTAEIARLREARGKFASGTSEYAEADAKVQAIKPSLAAAEAARETAKPPKPKSTKPAKPSRSRSPPPSPPPRSSPPLTRRSPPFARKPKPPPSSPPSSAKNSPASRRPRAPRKPRPSAPPKAPPAKSRQRKPRPRSGARLTSRSKLADG